MELTNSYIIDKLRGFSEAYQDARPFPHLIIDKLWSNSLIEEIESEFNRYEFWDGHKKFFGSINKKYSNDIQNFLPYTKSLVDFCNSPYFIKFLEDLTGIKNLKSDPSLLGGGMHSTGQNGFLKMHVDFNWNQSIKMYRRINLLIYLNKEWDPHWNGDLIFGKKYLKDVIPKKKIGLKFNRTIIFNTDLTSWHGHPWPLKCPNKVRRNSLALYYYTLNNITNEKRVQTVYLK